MTFLKSFGILFGSMDNLYELIDSGDGLKLERFGSYLLIRPAAQAIWPKKCSDSIWRQADATFTREGGNSWQWKAKAPREWVAEVQGIRFKIAPTDFGHLGVFPEHSLFWDQMKDVGSVLNLFAYSGGATLAAAKAGAKVCHVDASKGMVAWARENAQLNQLEHASIRWIVDDVLKFMQRELKRGVRYEGIILDPPSFGRGAKGELFKIERDLLEILRLCRQLLSDEAKFVFLTTHTPGMTPLVMHHLMHEMMGSGAGQIECGEMVIPSRLGRSLPSGAFAKWTV